MGGTGPVYPTPPLRKAPPSMTSSPPGFPAGPPAPIAELVVGQHFQAWTGTALYCSGTVEPLTADLGVPWVREDRIGARRLLDVTVHQICYHPAPPCPWPDTIGLTPSAWPRVGTARRRTYRPRRSISGNPTSSRSSQQAHHRDHATSPPPDYCGLRHGIPGAAPIGRSGPDHDRKLPFDQATVMSTHHLSRPAEGPAGMRWLVPRVPAGGWSPASREWPSSR